MTAPAKSAKPAVAAAGDDAAGGGLSALDWVVLVAALAGLGVLGVWLYKGQPVPPRRTDNR